MSCFGLIDMILHCSGTALLGEAPLQSRGKNFLYTGLVIEE